MLQTCTCACMCECVCAHVRARLCVINEKAPFSGFCYLINHVLIIYPSDFNDLYHVGLFASVFMRR